MPETANPNTMAAIERPQTINANQSNSRTSAIKNCHIRVFRSCAIAVHVPRATFTRLRWRSHCRRSLFDSPAMQAVGARTLRCFELDGDVEQLPVVSPAECGEPARKAGERSAFGQNERMRAVFEDGGDAATAWRRRIDIQHGGLCTVDWSERAARDVALRW